MANEKFDLGDDNVFLFEDCIVTSMPDKDTSNGGVSWSSGSFPEPISDPVVLVSCPGSSNFLSHGIDSCAWESGTGPSHMCYVGFPLNLMSNFSVHSKSKKRSGYRLKLKGLCSLAFVV